jgi:hypothetical protein
VEVSSSVIIKYPPIIPGAENNSILGIPLFETNNARERFLTAEETQRLRDALKESDNPKLQYIVLTCCFV